MTGLALTILILILLVIALRYASRRQSTTAVAAKPKRVLSFTTEDSPEAVVQAILERTQGSTYTIDKVADANPRLILSTPPTATTWGFFYPIYLTRHDDGRTLVEVGIQSRLYQVGPLVRKQHEQCFAHVQEAVLAGKM